MTCGAERRFEDLWEAVVETVSHVDADRIRMAHRDLVVFARLHDEWGETVNRLAAGKQLREISPDESAAAVSLAGQMHTLLRAAIVFGDLVNLVLLQEVLGARDRDAAVTWLSSKEAPMEVREWASRLDPDAFLLAHVLRIYRNQIILHFERPRSQVATWRTEDWSQPRLVPIDFSGATEEAHARLEDLARKYAELELVSAVQEVEPGRHNFWELLEALFYSVPPLVGTDRNLDRAVLDRLVAHGGVKSPSMRDVLSAVHRFGNAVADRIEAGDLPPRQEPG